MLSYEEFGQYVTIVTHLGLFHYICILFGVAASPAIFQQTMDSIMSDIVDDLIVTGSNDMGHLPKLENTLKCLDSNGCEIKVCMFIKSSIEYRVSLRKGYHRRSSGE